MPSIAVITTSRADYGIYRPLLRMMRAEGMPFDLMVGGSHLSAMHGHTVDEIRGDDVGPVHVVSHLEAGDTDADVAHSAAAAVRAFADVILRLQPAVLVVLGDRYEMLAAGYAAALVRAPLAHLHGGDVTEGAYDEQFRHALTKLSHLHFPSIEAHRQRILAMGEEPWRVTVVGALALDELKRFTPPTHAALCESLGFDRARPILLLVYHPETLDTRPPQQCFAAIADALTGIPANVLVIGGNADTGHLQLQQAMRDWVARNPAARYVPSLSQHAFWGWMSHAGALVGNSSAGPIEAASFGLPVVNIGDRQRGRLRGTNVLDAAYDAAAIRASVQQALSTPFRKGLVGLANAYGDGQAAGRILAVLRHLPSRDQLLKKRWHAVK